MEFVVVNRDLDYDTDEAIEILKRNGYYENFDWDQFNGDPNDESTNQNGPIITFFTKINYGHNQKTLDEPVSKFISKAEYEKGLNYILSEGILDEDYIWKYEEAKFFHALWFFNDECDVHLKNGEPIKFIEFMEVKF